MVNFSPACNANEHSSKAPSCLRTVYNSDEDRRFSIEKSVFLKRSF